MGVWEWEGGGRGYEKATGGIPVLTQTVRILNASVSISCFDTKLVLQDISYYWGETE